MAHDIVKRKSFAIMVFGPRAWTMVRALLAASVVASAPLAALLSSVVNLTSSAHFRSDFLFMWLAWAMIAVAMAYTFGLPWHVLALRNNWRRGHSYLLAGSALGGALGIVGSVALTIPLIQSGGALPLLFFAVTAAITCSSGVILMGGTMWFAWLLRRPDRDAARSDVAGEFD